MNSDIETPETPDSASVGQWTPEVVTMLEDALGERRAAGLMTAATAGRKAEAARAREPWWRRPIHHDPDPVPPTIARLLLRVADGEVLDREDEDRIAATLGRDALRSLRRTR